MGEHKCVRSTDARGAWARAGGETRKTVLQKQFVLAKHTCCHAWLAIPVDQLTLTDVGSELQQVSVHFLQLLGKGGVNLCWSVQ